MINIDAYRRDGYIVVRDPKMACLKARLSSSLSKCVLTALEKESVFCDAVAMLNDHSLGDIIDYIVQHETANEVSGRIYRIFPAAPELMALIGDPTILGWLRALELATPIAGTTPLVRIDRPGDEAYRTPAHQDWWFSLLSPNCVTVWFPLRPLDSDMGLLEVVPGSHRRGAIAFCRNVETNNEPFRPKESYLDSDFRQIEVPDDAALIFSQYLLHRSGFNRSERTRLSVQLRYNDVATMERAESSYGVKHSDYVLERQQQLLSAR